MTRVLQFGDFFNGAQVSSQEDSMRFMIAETRFDRSSLIPSCRLQRVSLRRFDQDFDLQYAIAKWLKQSGIVLLLPHGCVIQLRAVILARHD